MPENANNIPLDDEDILDLTVVAESGKKSDGPPEPGMDFGADLDALLDSLGTGGDLGAFAQPAAQAAPPVSPAPSVQAAPPAQAAPIADQTPVDHAVDPDEELAMPEMSDIDSLLAELGADVPAKGAASAPATPKAAPAPAPDFDDILAQTQADAAPKTAPAPDIDDLFAQAQAAVAAKPAPAPAPDVDDILAEVVAPKAAPASAPMPEFDAILAQAQAAEAAKAEEEVQTAAPMPEPSIDPIEAALSAALNRAESKPAVAVPPAVEAETPTVKAGSPAISVSATLLSVTRPDPVVETAPPAVNAVAEELDALEETEEDIDLNELDALLDDILATAPEMSAPAPSPAAVPESAQPEVIPVPDQAIMPASEDIAALVDRVQRLEEAVEVLEAQEISEPLVDGLIDAKLEAKIAVLLEPGSPIMDRILNEIRGRFADGAFNEDLEKMAAAAAAKVIREEIAALMAED